MLFENCLQKEDHAISYRRKSTDNIILTTNNNYYWATVRVSPVGAEFIEKILVNIDELFIRMLYNASTYNHAIYRSSNDQENLSAMFDNIATEIGRWDSIPKCIILSDQSKFFKDQDELIVRMKGCSCSEILNNVLSGEFTVSILRYSLPVREKEIGFFLSNCCGYFFEQDERVQALVRPVGCFCFEIEKE